MSGDAGMEQATWASLSYQVTPKSAVTQTLMLFQPRCTTDNGIKL
jgi:hypothetical protein